MNKESSKLISSDKIPWSFTPEAEGEIATEVLEKLSEQSKENCSIKVNIKTFSTSNSLIQAKRFEITAGDNTVFLFDKILSQIPVNIKTKFQIKCAKDLKCNVADKNKLVIRQGVNGEKFFRLLYQADGNDISKTAGLMFPDEFCENSGMGLTYYSGLYTFAKEHNVLYGICYDTPKEVGRWHFFAENDFIIASPPSKVGGYRIAVSPESLFVENLDDICESIKIDI